MPTTEMPLPDVAVTQRLLGLAPARGSHQALAGQQDRGYSYGELAAAIQAAAAGLAWRGLHPRDVVGVLVPDAACYALATHAIRAAGGVPSPVAAGLTVPEMAGQLADCGARMLLTAPPLAAAALAAADRSWVRQVISFADAPGATPFEALLQVRLAAAGRGRRSDPALLPYARRPRRHAEPGRAVPARAGRRTGPGWPGGGDHRAGHGAGDAAGRGRPGLHDPARPCAAQRGHRSRGGP